MIYFDDVTMVYRGGTKSLDKVTFTVSAGEFVSIVGPSGAGKTTLIKLLLAEEAPTSGKVMFEEVDLNSLHRYEVPAYRRRIGVVFQDFRLLPNKTAYENIAFAMEAAGQSDTDIAADVPYVLDLVDLSDMKFRFPRELSGGERQRLAIARAIINQPEVVVADEPTGNLDSDTSHSIVDLLFELNRNSGTTLVLVTHDRELASKTDRILRIDHGKVVEET